MSRHLLEWLPAYHDGELGQECSRLVEAHLKDCESCRTELKALETLSSHLKAERAPEFTPAARFTARVQMSLPRADAVLSPKKSSSTPAWAVGTALILVFSWAFLQAALMVAAVILNAEWVFNLPGPIFPAGVLALDLPWFINNLLAINFALLAGTAIFWSLWLAAWLAWQKDQMLAPA